MKLRTVIVDDEPVAVRRLSRLLEAQPCVDLVGTAGTGTAARPLLLAHRPDLLLLDIEMPGQSGLDLAAGLDPVTAPVVVFVTAFHQYALEAFGLDSADYLLKPIEPDRLEAAISRAIRRLQARAAGEREAELQAVVSALRERLAADQALSSIWVRDGREDVRISLASVRWLEAERDYVRIHTDRRSLLVRGQLRDYEARLPKDHFQRVHRSAIVRLDAVSGVRCKGDRALVLTLIGGEEISVSRAFAPDVHRWRSQR